MQQDYFSIFLVTWTRFVVDDDDLSVSVSVKCATCDDVRVVSCDHQMLSLTLFLAALQFHTFFMILHGY